MILSTMQLQSICNWFNNQISLVDIGMFLNRKFVAISLQTEHEPPEKPIFQGFPELKTLVRVTGQMKISSQRTSPRILP